MLGETNDRMDKGASTGRSRVAGAGGVIRDEMGVWKQGFCINLGIASNIIAELWGIV